MSVPLGALVSKSRRMTLSSCCRDSTVDRSSWGMTLEGKTRRPCRLRTKAFMRVLSDTSGSDTSGSDTSGSDTSGSDTSGPAAGLLLPCPLHPPLDGRDEPRSQLGGGDDVVYRADLAGPPDVVDRLELRGDLAQLLRADAAAQGRVLPPQTRLLHPVRGVHRRLQLAHPGIGGGAPVDFASEDDGGGRRAAQHRGVRALDGKDLHVLVQHAGEHDEGSAVVPGDDAEHDRAVEVGDGPAD